MILQKFSENEAGACNDTFATLGDITDEQISAHQVKINRIVFQLERGKKYKSKWYKALLRSLSTNQKLGKCMESEDLSLQK